MSRRPVDPEEELRWMAQEVRGYVEAVLNSLAANVPKVGLNFDVLCTSLYSFSVMLSFMVHSLFGFRQLFSAK